MTHSELHAQLVRALLAAVGLDEHRQPHRRTAEPRTTYEVHTSVRRIGQAVHVRGGVYASTSAESQWTSDAGKLTPPQHSRCDPADGCRWRERGQAFLKERVSGEI